MIHNQKQNQVIYDAVSAASTKNIVTNSSTDNNHLLYSFFGDDDNGNGDNGDDPEPDDITLSVDGYKIQGLQKADLTWSAATSDNVDDASNIATVANTGSYTDDINVRGGGTYTYQVCEAGTSTCSNEVTIQF